MRRERSSLTWRAMPLGNQKTFRGSWPACARPANLEDVVEARADPCNIGPHPFLAYFTPEDWVAMKGGPSTAAAAEEIITTRLLQLGATCLAEPTLKCMASLLLLLSDPNAINLPAASKKFF